MVVVSVPVFVIVRVAVASALEGRSSGGAGEVAVKYSPGRDHVVGQGLDPVGLAFRHDNLHAPVVVEVYVHGCDDRAIELMLHVVEFARQVGDVVIVNDGDGANGFLVMRPFLFDQGLSDQVSDRLGTVGVGVVPDIPVEALKERPVHGYAETF